MPNSRFSPFSFKKSLAIELFDFFQSLSEHIVTKSAFVQARNKIKPIFFQHLFDHTALVFYRRFPIHRWKGHRLWATDGTAIRLPDEPCLGEHFGWHENQYNRVPSIRWLCTYDVLNKLITTMVLHSRRQAEVTVVQNYIDGIPEDVVVIYDRGFASYAIPWLHLFYGSNCVVRVKTSFNPTVISFVQSGEYELIVDSSMPERACRSLRKLGFRVKRNDRIRYRLIRVDLPTGETEVLLTTLLNRKKYHYRHFGELYAKRWGVETCFHLLKSYFQAASFASYTINNVEQELWAMFALFNIQTICNTALTLQVDSLKTKRKYPYQLNRNVGLGYLKRFLPSLFINVAKRWWTKLRQLLDHLIKAVEPVRKGLNKKRRRRLMRGAERHIYESNYKPTL